MGWDRLTRSDQTMCRLGLFGSAIILLAGCGIGSARKTPAELEVERLGREKAALAGNVEQYRSEIEQLQAQIKALTTVSDDERANPYQVMTVRISRFSNFYDKDGDGRQEKLIVYVQVVDREGDIVKAGGAVSVQLWDLARPDGQALLGQWQVAPQELRRLWYDAMISSSYRLTFDRPEALDVLVEPLTVKVAFTDSLTGETFRDQRVINPKLD